MTGKKMARISVLMGIYNCASTLPEALDSLYAQTYQDFKIILCDDGSTDSTYDIAKSYAEKHDNIVLIKNERNMGLNYTLNHCLEFADTEYCARMDGDDISLPTRFEVEYNFLESHPEYAIVSTPMFYFDENGIFRVGEADGEPEKRELIKGTPFCHAPCMVRKEAYEAVGGYSVSGWLLRVEDYHLWYKMYLKGYRGYRINQPLYMMRDDRNALHRRSFRNRRNEAYVKFLIWKGFKLPFYDIMYCFRPLVLAVLPSRWYSYLHKKKIS